MNNQTTPLTNIEYVSISGTIKPKAGKTYSQNDLLAIAVKEIEAKVISGGKLRSFSFSMNDIEGVKFNAVFAYDKNVIKQAPVETPTQDTPRGHIVDMSKIKPIRNGELIEVKR